MSVHSAEIFIRRPPDEVFRFMDDVSREREWQPNLRSASQDPPGPSRSGTVKRYESEFMGRTVRNSYRVLEVEPGRRMVQVTTPGSSAEIRSETTWTEVDGGTRVVLRVTTRPSGVFRFIPRALLESTARNELQAGLRRLKAILEREE